MANDKEALMGMGFDAARVEWALKATGNRGLQPAMDHLFENEGKPIPDLSAVSESASRPANAMDVDDDEDAEALKTLGLKANDIEAKSIKCSECGKVFRNTAVAQFHAEKSGHDQFEESTEEIKPLTEEEKKEKLAELRQKMIEKREKKAIEDAKEQKVSETIRRKAGKDMGQIKEDMEKRQAMKDAEQKKKDKIDDARARAAIKAQIEADKKTRAEKFAREKALRHGQEIVDAPASAPVASASTAAPTGVAGKDFKETRLQIRMSTGGQPYTTTLPSESPLREVAEFLAGQLLTVDVETISFAQHFPRKAFTKSDFSKSLRELGLTPSAVLIATPPGP
ncbi:DNA-binding protein [Mycena rosella]|uniref:DNA-binding protein n=1 Tax=Mycena rosella TaxID=1033263 RepID=A0AAD7MB23_MYCRO|nr:DNA-binding protein [Mycena rosella]